MDSMRPDEIRFAQKTISNHFDNGKLIGETLDDLCEGRCRVEDIPTISVCRIKGKWYSADNRRLWVFQKLHELKKCDTIPVLVVNDIPKRKLTTDNKGKSVEVIGSPGGKWFKKIKSPYKPCRKVKSRKTSDIKMLTS
ncbi:hypothetical protein ACJMK2_034258 [Sinanodonta woodiana]|uniref:Uncharacterized protein n=1 Tax=Sinanodonta woodiana TaxID=1069815 RepID=A0ABD3WR02_SINWO